MKLQSKYRLLMMLLRSPPSIGGVTALRKHQIMLGTCGLKIYMSERLKPHKSYFITPPCDYKPFDQSAGSSVRTCSKHGEVLNLVVSNFPCDGAATAIYNQRVPLPFPLVFFGYRVPAGQSMRGLLRKEVVSVSKNTGFNRL